MSAKAAAARDRRRRSAQVWLKRLGLLVAWGSLACALLSLWRVPAPPMSLHTLITLAAGAAGSAVFLLWLAFEPQAPPPEVAPLRAAGPGRTPDAVINIMAPAPAPAPAPALAPLPAPASPPPPVPALPPAPVSPPPAHASSPEELSALPPLYPGAATPGPFVLPAVSPLYSDEAIRPAGALAAAPVGASPFLDDPLFQLEDPGPGARVFQLAKDPLQLCQDSFAADPQRGIYAVTDGVSNSFMSAPWARIVAQAFVSQEKPFANQAEFTAWLDAAGESWRVWMHETWVPAVNRLREMQGQSPEDWSRKVEETGAQTTLVGCAISRSGAGSEAPVHVIAAAIGDSECLLFRPARNGWRLGSAFPLRHPDDFGVTPPTLLTRSDPSLVPVMYQWVRWEKLEARPGDRVVLASDAIARWLLTQALAEDPPPGAEPSAGAVEDWHRVLTMSDPVEFERLVRGEIRAGRMEEDDVVLAIITIQ